MPFCIDCGQEIYAGAKFCSGCDATINNGVQHEASKRKFVFEGEIHKCPNCGEVINSFVSICPA